MPNYYKTLVKPKDAKQFMNCLAGSFDNVIPMPKELDIFAPSPWDVIVKQPDVHLINDQHTFLKSLQNDFEEAYNSSSSKDEYTDKCATILDRDDEFVSRFGESEKSEVINGFYNFKKYGYTTWLDWRVSNWGTKWDIVDISNNEDEDNLIFTIVTAWTMPIPVLKKISMATPLLVVGTEEDCAEPDCAIFSSGTFTSITLGDSEIARLGVWCHLNGYDSYTCYKSDDAICVDEDYDDRLLITSDDVAKGKSVYENFMSLF